MSDQQDAPTRLRVWMAVADLSVKEVAARLCVGEDCVSDWRRGRHVPVPAQRQALERESAGAVPATAWES